MRHQKTTSILLSVALAATAVIATPWTASAASEFVVTTYTDSPDASLGDGICDDGFGGCTLRAALEEGAAVGGDDTIRFERPMRIELNTELTYTPFQASDSLTIIGQGMGATTLDGQSVAYDEVTETWSTPDRPTAHRVLRATASNITIRDLTIAGGGHFPASGVGFGGGAHLSSTTSAELTRVEFRSNASGESGGDSSQGGALFIPRNSGPTTITDARFIANTTDGWGGAIWSLSALTVEGSLFERNGAMRPLQPAVGTHPDDFVPRAGGAIAMTSLVEPLVVRSARFYDNGAASGGAINAANADIHDSVFDGNRVNARGGAIVAGSLQVQRSQFTGNQALGFLSSNPVTGAGGAINLQGAGLINESLFDGNHAREGGAISTEGVDNQLELANTSVVNNTASFGGGLHLSIPTGVAPYVSNVSLVGNAASDIGGGMRVTTQSGSSPAAVLEHVTAAFNAAPAGAQLHGFVSGSSTIELTNSIVDYDDLAGGAGSQCQGVDFQGGNMTRESTLCRLDVAPTGINDFTNDSAGTNLILNRELGTSAIEVGAGHVGLPITPYHGAASYVGSSSCALPGAADARGISRTLYPLGTSSTPLPDRGIDAGSNTIPPGACSAGALQSGIWVDTTADDPAVTPVDACDTAAGRCSLRAAIDLLNELGAHAAIELVTTATPTTYGLNSELALTTGSPLLTVSPRSGGDGQPDVVQLADGARNFSVSGGSLEVVGLDLYGGDAPRLPVSGDGGVVLVGDTSSYIQRGGTLTEGRATGSGGGLAASDSMVLLDGVELRGHEANVAGGAIHLSSHTELTVRDSVVHLNAASERGGAIHAAGAAAVLIEGTRFTDNQAGSSLYSPSAPVGPDATGGAIHLGPGAKLSLRSIIIEHSHVGGASLAGGGTAQGYGAALASEGDNTIVIEPLSFLTSRGLHGLEENVSTTQAGGLAVTDTDSIGVDPNSTTSVRITSTSFADNLADGAAVLDVVGDVDLMLVDSEFLVNNAGVGGGGAIGFQGAQLGIVGTRFVGNSSQHDAGSVYVTEVAPGSATLTIIRSVFDGNHADGDGGAVVYEATDDVHVLASEFNENSAARGGAWASRASGNLSVLRSHFNDNTALYSGGAIDVQPSGGAIQLVSTVLDSNVQQLAGPVGVGGGAIYFDAPTEGIQLTYVRSFDNRADEGDGGFLHVNRALAMHSFGGDHNGNVALQGSGGAMFVANGVSSNIQFTDFLGNQANTSGGAIHSTGDLLLRGGDISANQTSGGGGSGGALHLTGLDNVHSIALADFGSNESAGDGSAISMQDAAVMTIEATDFHDNIAVGGGTIIAGGFGTLSVDETHFANNDAEFGAGLAIGDFGAVEVAGGSFVGNTAVDGDGGAILASVTDGPLTISGASFDGNATTPTAARGGAIRLIGLEDVVTISDSSFSNNGSGSGGHALSVADGAGTLQLESVSMVDNSGWGKGTLAIDSGFAGTTNMVNSTIARNSTTSPFDCCAGLYHEGGSLSVDHSTIVGNSSNLESDQFLSIQVAPGPFTPATISRSIIGLQQRPNGASCFGDGVTVVGPVVASQDETPSCLQDLTAAGVDHDTADLSVDGLVPGTLIIEPDGHIEPPVAAANLVTTPCPVTVDARGTVRPQFSRCDVGAIESLISPPDPEMSVTLEADKTQVVPGASVVPAEQINGAKLKPKPGAGGSTQASPLDAIPLDAIPLDAIPLDAIPLDAIPLDAINFDSPAVAAALQRVRLHQLELLAPVAGFETIADMQAASTFADTPSQAVTLVDLYNDPIVGGDLAAAPLDAIDLSGTPLDAIPLWTVLLVDLPIADLPWESILEPNGDRDATAQENWDALCSHLAQSDFDCTTLVSVPSAPTTVFEAGIVGAPLDAIPLDAVPLDAIPLDAIPLDAIPLDAIPLDAIPLDAIPLDAIPLDAIPLDGIQGSFRDSSGAIVSAPLDAIPLDAIPLDAIDAQGVPLDAIPLDAIPLDAIPLDAIDIDDAPLDAIPLDAIPLDAIPLDAIPLDAIPLDAIPLDAIPLDAIPLDAIPLDAIPLDAIPLDAIGIKDLPLDAIANVGTVVNCSMVNCGSGGDTLGTAYGTGAVLPQAKLGMLNGAFANHPASLADLLPALRNSSNPEVQARVGETTWAMLGKPALATVPFGSFRPFLAMSVGELVDVLSQTHPDEIQALLSSTTLGHLLAWGSITVADLALLLAKTPFRDVLAWVLLLPGSEVLSLFDLMLSLLPPSQFPWTEANLAEGGIQESLGDQATLVSYTAEVAVSDLGPAQVNVSFELPRGGHVTTGTKATIASPSGVRSTSVASSNGLASFTLETTGTEVLTVTLNVAAPLAIGDQNATVTVQAGPLTASATTGVKVVEEFEPNDTLADLDSPAGKAAELADGTLFLSHIGQPGDVDLYTIEMASGDALTAFLGNVPADADFDLVLYGPPNSGVPGVGVNAVNSDGAQNADDIVLVDGVPALAISAKRGTNPERIDLPPVQFPGRYVLAVSGFNDDWSVEPYTLQAKQFAAPTLPPCAPWPSGVENQAITTLDLPVTSDTRTLFVVNRDRYQGVHQADSPNALMVLDGLLSDVSSLDGSNGSPIVNGAVLDVQDIPAINAAYENWSTADGRCDVNLANGVATAIATEVAAIRGGVGSGIQHVVVVGDDLQIPFLRVPDFTEIANERTYAGSLRRADGLSDELLAASTFGYYLTDNHYADASLESAGNRPIHVPEVAIGRLVETHGQITTQLEDYLASDGRLDPASAQLVAGYDFLADGATAIADALDAHDGVTPSERIIDGYHADEADLWTAARLAEELSVAGRRTDVVSVNAHYDHRNLLSSAEDAGGTKDDLFGADDVAGDFRRSIAFTMGCHGGLSVSNISVGSEVLDWAEMWADNGAMYVGNTGFGYGDTDVVALSELLLANFADRLGQHMTVGQAMASAKAEYAADLATYGVYDEKVLMEATFYGLPMYRIGVPGELPAPEEAVELTTDHGLPANDDVDLDAQVASPSTPAGGTLLRPVVNDDGETHYLVEVDGTRLSPQALGNQPVQPRWEQDVTAHDGFGNVTARAHGAIIEGLHVAGPYAIDPVIATPVVDAAGETLEPQFDDLIFPTVFARVSRYETPIGPRDQLVVVPGQFTGSSTSGSQILMDEVDTTVYYAPETATDFTAPRILRTTAAASGNAVGFTVEAADTAGIQRVLILYREPGQTQWKPAELSRQSTGTTQRWTGGGTLTQVLATGQQVAYFAQALDANGNVGVTTAKAAFHSAVVVEPPTEPGGGGEGGTVGEPVVDSDEPKQGTWFTGDVTVTIESDGDGDAQLFIDGQQRTAPVVLDQSGTYEVTVVDEGVSNTTFVFIDKDAPTIEFNIPADVGGSSPMYAKGAVVAVDVVVDDLGSGVAQVSGIPEFANTASVGHKTITVTATDNVGHESTASQGYDVVEVSGPTAPIEIGVDYPLSVIGTIDPSGLLFDWGDGDGYQTPDPADVTIDVDRVVVRHAYAVPGLYTVHVRRGQSQPIAYEYVAVFDPDGGHITGSVKFQSPAGALYSDTTLFGEAKLGVSAKYKKGDSVPDGKTNFQFKDGDLKFKSKTYDVLIVDGNRAQWFGTGELNKNEGYRFTVVAIDNGKKVATLPDKVRVRIWRDLPDGSTQLVYDNGLGGSMDGDSGTFVTKGDVKIEDG